MARNVTSAVLLTLETVGFAGANIYVAFLFGTLIYLIIMFCNLLVATSIAMSKQLHKPMFILLFNLPISDMLGATAFFPHFVFSILTQNRLIPHSACIIQAFLIHVYGTGNLLILSAMAFDRYMAICCPLRYNTIMTPNNLVRIIVFIWVLNITLMGILFFLLVRFRVCRTNVVDLYCNNPSLVKLACEDTRVNNYYGLLTVVVIIGGSLAFIIYTYAHILRTCIITTHPDSRRKALQTCSTHLIVFLILEFNTLVTLLSHRFAFVSPFLRRCLGVSILVFPPFLDPIVYGLNTKELKQSIMMFIKRNAAVRKM